MVVPKGPSDDEAVGCECPRESVSEHSVREERGLLRCLQGLDFPSEMPLTIRGARVFHFAQAG